MQYSQTSLGVMHKHTKETNLMKVIKTVLSLAARYSCLQVLEHVFLFLGIRTKNVALIHLRYNASRKYKNRGFF